MNRILVLLFVGVMVSCTLVGTTSAQFGWFPGGYSSYTHMQNAFWGPGGGGFSSYTHMASASNWGWGGRYSNFFSSYNRMFAFMANETEIEDVTGEWETDLFGPLYLKLTGDDILRGMYEVEGYKGYLQGNFTGNSTPNVEGLWWQEPTYQPLNNAGGFSMTFDFEEATMEGIFAYADGTWAPFTGEKVSADLSEEMDEALFDMPEYNPEISEEEMEKVIDAPNPYETNPLSEEAAEEEVITEEEERELIES
ncbi:MAG: hypothetical protein JXA44_02700 [Methanospirillaceae archaeon]|nr:hypothetical protein [Methanospirillaceae archaeon]